MSHRVSGAAFVLMAQIMISLAPLLVWSGALATPGDGAVSRIQDPTPSPEFEPPDVVRIQVEALRGNGPDDKGIEVAFRFASPGNKQYTGPLARFIEMVRSAPYDRLLNHLNAEYSATKFSDNRAYQIVTITDRLGAKAAYLWVLSKQTEGKFEDCWMTDSVIPSRTPEERFTMTSY